ncbi:MAG: hypothetical protein H6934_12820 [Burkholderiaceae bacterium]|nr:hypothetical protein [Burkholderiaceae bacterium]
MATNAHGRRARGSGRLALGAGSDPPPGVDELDACGIPALLDSIGRGRFSTAFHRFVAARVAIDQCTAWRVAAGQAPRCLVSERPGETGVVEALCRVYAQTLHRHDPVLRGGIGDLPTVRRVRLVEIGQPDYRRELFERVRLDEKIVVHGRHDDAGYYLSLYRRREREPFSDAEIATVASMQRTLLAALARHAELREPREERSPAAEALAVNLRRFFATHPARLSEREAETCVQIALGHANGAIADALGVSTHTVNTFRRRAYRKLEVGSVGALFGLYVGAVGD